MKKGKYVYVAIFSYEENGISIKFLMAISITQFSIRPNQVSFLVEVFMQPKGLLKNLGRVARK